MEFSFTVRVEQAVAEDFEIELNGLLERFGAELVDDQVPDGAVEDNDGD